MEDEEELSAVFYDCEEMYMKKPTYTETLASLETHLSYTREHLRSMDNHLAKLNDSVAKQQVQVARNKDRINLIFKLSGGLITISAIVVPILWATGIL